MRIALTVLLISAGLLAHPTQPQGQPEAAAPAPYEATILPAAFHRLVGDKACNPSLDV